MKKCSNCGYESLSCNYCPKCNNYMKEIQNAETKNINQTPSQVTFPKCGSTQIHVEKRGWKITTGFLGSSQIIITCLKCGHKWKAGK